jgi:hypothetical protein
MRVVINFRVGRDDQAMRLVIDNRGPQHIEARTTDALGDTSWRPADGRHPAMTNESIISRALQIVAGVWNAYDTTGTLSSSEVATAIVSGTSTLVINLGKVAP